MKGRNQDQQRKAMFSKMNSGKTSKNVSPIVLKQGWKADPFYDNEGGTTVYKKIGKDRKIDSLWLNSGHGDKGRFYSVQSQRQTGRGTSIGKSKDFKTIDEAKAYARKHMKDNP